jgi:hypothetical protein
MELRAEPRFETRSSAVVEVIRDKVYTYDITITEVSGSGLRIEMAEELTVGENIRLLVDNYHMFAQVRSCKPAESGFVLGLERIDAWNAPPAESASVPAKTATASPVKVVGRPELKNPLDNLRRAALGSLFADPRLRTTEANYKPILIAAGCIVLAGWAGFGVGVSLHRKPQGARPVEMGASKQLPGASKSADSVTPQKAAVTNPVSSTASSTPVVVPPLQKARVEAPPNPAAHPATVAPPLQTAHVEAPPARNAGVAAPATLTAHPATVPVSKISIKASDISWLTACADGAKVLDTLLVKGYAGQIPFSRQATLRFGNAGAVELAVGDQPLKKLGPSGEIRTIKVTPAGYELINIQSAFNCTLR